ncbi:hypothetical protein K6119_04325 [Paracrocinitomix mangrovi]|uniref:hypothetical protein n=1 Tax=Paracrocinitomix mangrovi TaxID=2862509 RepID=UPI001C8DB453|nr:hypothetical protein [Paracrocinitomix mangrovi]UKN02740.1 hypothetical protein K6119_04325 [Paracrocinitomix mangrovi]
MIHKGIVFLIFIFQSNLHYGQSDTIIIQHWNQLSKDGIYKISVNHTWDSSTTVYCGAYKNNKYIGTWIKYYGGDSIFYSYTDEGILVERKEYFGGKILNHDQIKFDTLDSPIIITKKYRLWHRKEPYNYENRPVSTHYFKIIDSLCDYSKFDYLWQSPIGGDGVYISDTNHRIHSYKGYYQACPKNQFKSQFESFESQGKRHLIFRKEFKGDSIMKNSLNEAYYYDGSKETLIAKFESNGELTLLIPRKMANEIVDSFENTSWLARDHKNKFKYTVLAMFMK